MAHKRRRKHLPFEVFRKEFLRLLGRRRADKIIQRILEDERSKNLCVRLLWDYQDTPCLAEMSERYLHFREFVLQEAINGVSLASNIFESLERRPQQVMEMKKALVLLRDLSKQPHIRLPLKQLGRDRDWSAVLRAKDQLEARLQCRLPHKTVAILVNVADEASDRQLPLLLPDAVEAALKRLRKRLLSA